MTEFYQLGFSASGSQYQTPGSQFFTFQETSMTAFKHDVGDSVSFTLHVLDSFQRPMTGVVEKQVVVLDDLVASPGYDILCEDGEVRKRREKDLDS